jgi:hypothetical protein
MSLKRHTMRIFWRARYFLIMVMVSASLAIWSIVALQQVFIIRSPDQTIDFPIVYQLPPIFSTTVLDCFLATSPRSLRSVSARTLNMLRHFRYLRQGSHWITRLGLMSLTYRFLQHQTTLTATRPWALFC